MLWARDWAGLLVQRAVVRVFGLLTQAPMSGLDRPLQRIAYASLTMKLLQAIPGCYRKVTIAGGLQLPVL